MRLILLLVFLPSIVFAQDDNRFDKPGGVLPKTRGMLSFSRGNVLENHPEVISQLPRIDTFAMEADFGDKGICLHSALRVTNGRNMLDARDLVNQKRDFNLVGLDFGGRVFFPLGYFQPYFGIGLIVGNMTVGGEARYGAGETLDAGIDIVFGPQAKERFVLRVGYRREQTRTSGDGEYADFGYRADLITFGIGGDTGRRPVLFSPDPGLIRQLR